MRRPLPASFCSEFFWGGCRDDRREAIELRVPPCFHAHSGWVSRLASTLVLEGVRPVGCCYLLLGLVATGDGGRFALETRRSHPDWAVLRSSILSSVVLVVGVSGGPGGLRGASFVTRP
jgi:hypothetical protein